MNLKDISDQAETCKSKKRENKKENQASIFKTPAGRDFDALQYPVRNQVQDYGDYRIGDYFQQKQNLSVAS